MLLHVDQSLNLSKFPEVTYYDVKSDISVAENRAPVTNTTSKNLKHLVLSKEQAHACWKGSLQRHFRGDCSKLPQNKVTKTRPILEPSNFMARKLSQTDQAPLPLNKILIFQMKNDSSSLVASGKLQQCISYNYRY